MLELQTTFHKHRVRKVVIRVNGRLSSAMVRTGFKVPVTYRLRGH